MSRQRNRRVLFSSGAGLLTRAVQLVTTLITVPLVLHAVGLAGFGVWGAATSLAWLAGMLDLGLGAALLTLVPESLAAGAPERARDYVAAALASGCVLALLILGGGAALVPRAASPVNAAPLLVAVAGIALFIPLGISRAVWFGLQKGYIAALWDTVQSALQLGGLVLAASAHGDVLVMTAIVYASVALSNAGCLAHLLISHKQFRPVGWGVSIGALAAVLRKGGMLFGASVAVLSSYGFDNLLALYWLGPAAAGQMAIAARLCLTALGMIAVVIQPLWPAFVEAAALGDRAWERRALAGGSLMVAALTVLGGFVIIGFGQAILDSWLRENVGIGPAMLWSVVAWIAAFAGPSIAGLLLNALSVLRFQIIVTAAAAVLALGLKFPLARHFGVPGLVLSSAAAWILVIWPAYLWWAWRRLSPRAALARQSKPAF